jgi:hypothetical protein
LQREKGGRAVVYPERAKEPTEESKGYSLFLFATLHTIANKKELKHAAPSLALIFGEVFATNLPH